MSGSGCQLKEVAPIEAFTGFGPDVSCLLKFGCDANVNILSQLRNGKVSY